MEKNNKKFTAIGVLTDSNNVLQVVFTDDDLASLSKVANENRTSLEEEMIQSIINLADAQNLSLDETFEITIAHSIEDDLLNRPIHLN